VFLTTALRELPDLSVAIVVVGDSAQAIAMRAVTRVMSLGKRQLSLHADVNAAANWLDPRISIEGVQLAGVLAEIMPRTPQQQARPSLR